MATGIFLMYSCKGTMMTVSPWWEICKQRGGGGRGVAEGGSWPVMGTGRGMPALRSSAVQMCLCYLRGCAKAAVLHWWKFSARIKLILSYKMHYLLLSYSFSGTLKRDCEELKHLSSGRHFHEGGEREDLDYFYFFFVEEVFHVKK